MVIYRISRIQNIKTAGVEIQKARNIGALWKLVENKSEQRQLLNRILIWNDGGLAKII